MNKLIDKLKKKPIRLRVEGAWVGVGGDIKITRKPPKKSEVIKEAAEAQYKVLAKRFPDFFIKILEKKAKPVKEAKSEE